MTSTETVSDVQQTDSKDETKVQPQLVGTVTENGYVIGILREGMFDAKTGNYTLSEALNYSTVDLAIAELQRVLDHARQVQVHAAFVQGRQQALSEIAAQEEQPDSQVSLDMNIQNARGDMQEKEKEEQLDVLNTGFYEEAAAEAIQSDNPYEVGTQDHANWAAGWRKVEQTGDIQ